MTESQSDLTELALDVVPEETAIVSNLGKSSFALMYAEDRDRNYYMRGAMGSTTSTGLGVAVGTDDPVLVLDGDGSLLMSMGCLSTVGEYGPSNLVVVVWDNRRYATTGGQPTAAEETVDLVGVAENCGVTGFRAGTEAEFEAALEDALDNDGPSLVVARVETADLEPPDDFDYGCSYVKHRFRTALTEE
jgi:thiamine pyrophosphate-dependent acetolactate synthase large subunit-like protein